MFHRRNRLRLAAVAVAAAGCGAGSSGTAAGPAKGARTHGGTVTLANISRAGANYIFPFMSSTYYSVVNMQEFILLMDRSLYMEPREFAISEAVWAVPECRVRRTARCFVLAGQRSFTGRSPAPRAGRGKGAAGRGPS
jgi:hypothetical protein